MSPSLIGDGNTWTVSGDHKTGLETIVTKEKVPCASTLYSRQTSCTGWVVFVEGQPGYGDCRVSLVRTIPFEIPFLSTSELVLVGHLRFVCRGWRGGCFRSRTNGPWCTKSSIQGIGVRDDIKKVDKEKVVNVSSFHTKLPGLRRNSVTSLMPLHTVWLACRRT